MSARQVKSLLEFDVITTYLKISPSIHLLEASNRYRHRLAVEDSGFLGLAPSLNSREAHNKSIVSKFELFLLLKHCNLEHKTCNCTTNINQRAFVFISRWTSPTVSCKSNALRTNPASRQTRCAILRVLTTPQVPQSRVDLSSFVPATRIYDHASIQASVGSFSYFSSLPPPRPRSSPIESTFKSPSSEDTHIYQYPPVKVFEVPSSDDDDLPPSRPRDSLKKVISRLTSLGSTRNHTHSRAQVSEESISDDDDDDDDLPPPRPKVPKTEAVSKTPLVPWAHAVSAVEDSRQDSINRLLGQLHIHNTFRAQYPGLKVIPLWAVPQNMYWPWKQSESEAHQLLYNARINDVWSKGKTPCAYPRNNDGSSRMFSVYDRVLLKDLVVTTREAVNESMEGRKVGGDVNIDTKVWSIGCDFAIFSQSSRLMLQDTPVVPYELFGTCQEAENFIDSEGLMRGLAHLELLSIFELPNIMEGAELAKIAYAFFRGHEIPAKIDHLYASPLAIPTEYHIDYDGRSERAKVLASKPLEDEALQIFLQDVIISNYLEQVRAEDKRTMAGPMLVQRHPTRSDVQTELKAREGEIGYRPLTQSSKDRTVREQRRSRAWWAALAGVPAPGFDPNNSVPKLLRLITAGQIDIGSSQNDHEGDEPAEVAGINANELSGNGEASGTNGQIANSENPREQTTNSKKKKKGKGKSKKGEAVAGTGPDITPPEESSSISPQSVSDNAATNSSEQEISAEASLILIQRLAKSKKSHGAALLEVASTVVPVASVAPASSSSVPVTSEGKSKKEKKKRKNASNANASSAPNPSVSISKDQSAGKVADVQAIKAFDAKDQSVKKTAEDLPAPPRGEPTNTPISGLKVDSLGISMPEDTEHGKWETVKSRSAQKAKVTVPSTSRATRGNLGGQATTSRAGVKQPQIQQGSRVVAPLLNGGQISKVVFKVVPKELRVSDHNEFPAMPTPPRGKDKTQTKDKISDIQPAPSQSSPASGLATSTTQATLVTTTSNAKAPSLTTLDDIDFGGDLYGASPPRKTQVSANVEENLTSAVASKAISPIAVPKIVSKVDEEPSSIAPFDKGKEISASGSKDPTNASLDDKPVVPKHSEQTTSLETDVKAEKSDHTGSKLDPKMSIVIKDKGDGNSGSSGAKSKIAIPAMGGKKDTKGKAKAPFDMKSGSGTSATGSTPPEPKGKGKAPVDLKSGSGASATGSTLNESNGKGKASNTKSNVVASASTSSRSKNKKKGKGKGSAAERATQAVNSSIKSDIGQAAVSTSVATGSTELPGINKKTVHKHVGKKGAVSESSSAKVAETQSSADPKKPVVLDKSLTSSQEVSTKEQSNLTESILAVSSSDNIVSAAQPSTEVIAKKDEKPNSTLSEPLVASKQIPVPHVFAVSMPEMQKIDDINFKKQELTSVPEDLAWADLLSPTKPGHLKRRLSAGNRKPDNDILEPISPSPVRRSSFSADTPLGDLLFGPRTPIVGESYPVDDDPFVSETNGAEGPNISFTSSSSEVELRDSRASPETHATPRTELMLTPAADDYNGESYINVHGHELTLFRKDAEISNVPSQKRHQRASSGPQYGDYHTTQASSSRPAPQASHTSRYRGGGDFSYGRQNQSKYNSGGGAHSHPQPTYYGVPQANTSALDQDGHGNQGSASSQSLGGDLKGKGPDTGMQGGVFQGLSPIPEASIKYEPEVEEVEDHNPPTKCTFCEEVKTPTAADPFHFCPLCGVVPGTPRYCSVACLLANAWEHNSVCLNTPAYHTMSNTNLGPTYRWEHLPLNNCHNMPDSPEKYRQKIFAMFCKYGDVPDIRYANSRKWQDIDWSRLMPSCARTKVGDYHIFKSPATTSRRNQNPSKAIVICTIKFPLNDGVGMKLMITRALNVALVTHDASIIHFLCRLLRYALIRHFASFGATEPQEVVMTEFKTQFFKEFGLTYNDSEPLINPSAAFATIENILQYYEVAHGGIQYWLSAVFTRT
ncbi:hypothetical protein VTL71DRAFT_10899 [Oculimacula yallundae]|uniref:MYND-type zinc finger protein samB n=1 Tax=Oculimacula yallundae TaxID=86028 RepID=A0ABR4CUX2_9HELO